MDDPPPAAGGRLVECPRRLPNFPMPRRLIRPCGSRKRIAQSSRSIFSPSLSLPCFRMPGGQLALQRYALSPISTPSSIQRRVAEVLLVEGLASSGGLDGLIDCIRRAQRRITRSCRPLLITRDRTGELGNLKDVVPPKKSGAAPAKPPNPEALRSRTGARRTSLEHGSVPLSSVFLATAYGGLIPLGDRKERRRMRAERLRIAPPIAPAAAPRLLGAIPSDISLPQGDRPPPDPSYDEEPPELRPDTGECK